MFSKKLGFGLGAVIIFLVVVAFILGRPPHRDARIYPLVKAYTPYRIKKTLGGLRILDKENPEFKEEPDAVDFYKRVQALERQWAKTHLKIENDTLIILDNKGKTLKKIPLKTPEEKRFVRDYYGVR